MPCGVGARATLTIGTPEPSNTLFAFPYSCHCVHGENRGEVHSIQLAERASRGPARVPNRSFDRTSLDWFNAAMAANLRTTEELMRCNSPMNLLAVSSRFALRSWFNLWPLPRRVDLAV